MTARISHARFLLCFVGCLLRLAPLALLTTALCPAEKLTLFEGKPGPFLSRVVIWDAAEFTEPNLRVFYRELSHELKGTPAWTVDVFLDRSDATRESLGKLATETDYDRWLRLYTEFGHKLLPMAEILSYQNNAVLRLRDSAGTCSEVVLSGENFLRVQESGVDFEILKILYHSLPPHTQPSSGDEAMISIYVRSSSLPDVAQARDFTLLMHKRFRQNRLMVIFRTDAFFITDSIFPIMYRFDSRAVPPSREQYERSRTMHCFYDQPGLPCRE
jgi:hypothetical protein